MSGFEISQQPGNGFVSNLDEIKASQALQIYRLLHKE